MSKFYCVKTGYPNRACLKIVNEKGIEMSLAFDSSCGSSDTLFRVNCAFFENETDGLMIGEEILGIDAEQFLTLLAGHLGKKVV